MRNDRDLKIYLSVFDSNGNEFDDASSLIVNWVVDKLNVASFTEKETQYEHASGNYKNNQNGKTKSNYKIICLFFQNC